MSRKDFLNRWGRLDEQMRSTFHTYWHAGVESQHPVDPGMVDELSEYLASERDKEKRNAAYFTIGKLGLRCRSVDCARILIGAIGREKDKYVLSSLLDRIADIEKPREVDLRPIFPFLRDSRWLVRYAAIGAVGNSDSPEAEAEVIAHLTSTTDPNDIVCCNRTLGTIGTLSAIQHIEKNFASSNRDVKASAEHAVHAVMARHGVRPT